MENLAVWYVEGSTIERRWGGGMGECHSLCSSTHDQGKILG